MTAPATVANFDPVARPYRWMEYLTFGRALQRCRTHFIPELEDRRHALVLGDGDGRFLARLFAANASIAVDAVDSSAAMLRQLERRTSSACSRLHLYQADVLQFNPPRTYDLIVTHFFLDCLSQQEVDALATRLAQCAAPAALWVVSDFRIPGGLMRWPARAIVRLLYFAFRLLTGLRAIALPEHCAALTSAGFTRKASSQSLYGLLSSEIWEYTSAMQMPPQRPKSPHPTDPVPDPEPAGPSLPEPDPGVFHHDIGPPAADEQHNQNT